MEFFDVQKDPFFTVNWIRRPLFYKTISLIQNCEEIIHNLFPTSLCIHALIVQSSKLKSRGYPEKIRIKTNLVPLDSEFSLLQNIQNPLKSSSGKNFCMQISSPMSVHKFVMKITWKNGYYVSNIMIE